MNFISAYLNSSIAAPFLLMFSGSNAGGTELKIQIVSVFQKVVSYIFLHRIISKRLNV